MSWERKPKILLLSDVIGWAWDNKCKQLVKHLSNEFDFDIHYLLVQRTGYSISAYDLYVTFGFSYCANISAVSFDRRVSGVTAHKGDGFFKAHIIPAMKTVKWHHANSILLKKELEEGGFKDVYYVPNGVDEELFHEIISIPEHRSNLIVGHVGKKCGQGTDAKGQAKIIAPACKAADVEYKGHHNNYKNAIPHTQMVDIYQGIDVGIVASITDGTPNSLLETSACARPVVANRIGNCPEFIENMVNGILLEEREVNLYRDALLYLKNNRDKLIEMGKNARKTVEESWTWKIQAENYRTMFRDILSKVGLRK